MSTTVSPILKNVETARKYTGSGFWAHTNFWTNRRGLI